MKPTPLYILIQPETRHSYWAANIRAGIDDGVSQYRDTLCVLDPAQINDVSDTVYSLYQKPVLLVGNDSQWTASSIRLLVGYGARPILVNACMLPSHRLHCSGVVFELEEMVRYCVSYFQRNGRDRIAFLGANPHSITDHAKCSAFDAKEDIHYADGKIEDCVSRFLDAFRENGYNAVLCANDTVAICLIGAMQSRGYNLPRDCHVIGMGNSYLGANHSLSLSSVMFNYREMGEQAVHLYHTISKNPLPCRLTMSLPCHLIPRQSTENIAPESYLTRHLPAPEENGSPLAQSNLYFSGDLAQQIIAMEALLQGCDKTDRDILFAILRGDTNEKIAEQVFLTPRAVRYRIANFFKRNPDLTHDTFFDTLQEILTPGTAKDNLPAKKGTDK